MGHNETEVTPSINGGRRDPEESTIKIVEMTTLLKPKQIYIILHMAVAAQASQLQRNIIYRMDIIEPTEFDDVVSQSTYSQK